MARIRSVKPELRTSQLVASWPIEVRYFWVLLWGYLDDYGRGIDSAKTIAGDCFPWDDKIKPGTIERWLKVLTTKVDGEPGPLCRYTVGGKPYVHAVNWKEHQRPNRPTDSRIPQCPVHEGLSESLTEPDTESDSESLTERLHVGAAAGSSRGAGEQQQRSAEPLSEPPPPTSAERLLLKILEPDGCSAAEARAIAERVQRDRKPRNLIGLLRTIANAGELGELLAQVRAVAAKRDHSAALAKARDGPECHHGEPGGATPHPATGAPICPLCRTETDAD